MLYDKKVSFRAKCQPIGAFKSDLIDSWEYFLKILLREFKLEIECFTDLLLRLSLRTIEESMYSACWHINLFCMHYSYLNLSGDLTFSFDGTRTVKTFIRFILDWVYVKSLATRDSLRSRKCNYYYKHLSLLGPLSTSVWYKLLLFLFFGLSLHLGMKKLEMQKWKFFRNMTG